MIKKMIKVPRHARHGVQSIKVKTRQLLQYGTHPKLILKIARLLTLLLSALPLVSPILTNSLTTAVMLATNTFLEDAVALSQRISYLLSI